MKRFPVCDTVRGKFTFAEVIGLDVAAVSDCFDKIVANEDKKM